MGEEMNKSDFTLPEDVSIFCHAGRDITKEVCAFCGVRFDLLMQTDPQQVACADIGNEHVCYSCWDDLPESDDEVIE